MADVSCLTFYDYRRLLRRRQKIVIAAAVCTLLGAVLYNELVPPVYEAAVTVDIGPAPSGAGGQEAAAYLEAELKVLLGDEVLRTAAERAGRLAAGAGEREARRAAGSLRKDIKAAPSGKSLRHIDLAARAGGQREAAALAEAVVLAYAESRRERAAGRRKALAGQLEAADGALRRSEEALRAFEEKNWLAGARAHLVGRLMALRSEAESLRKTYTARHPEVLKTMRKISETEGLLEQQPRQELEARRLAGELRLRQAVYDEQAKLYGEAERAEAAEAAASPAVLPAEVSDEPALPRKMINLLTAAFLGLFLGACAAVTAESMDESLSTAEEIESRLELPVLALVGHLGSPPAGGGLRGLMEYLRAPRGELEGMRGKLAFRHPPCSESMEPYFALRANLRPAPRPGRRPGTAVCLTSAVKGEGKTLTGINFAFIAAQSGLRTLFVDGDMRSPQAHRLLSVRVKHGLAECLSGECSPENAVTGLLHLPDSGPVDQLYRQVPQGFGNLHFLPAGCSSANPADLLTPERARAFLAWAREHYDLAVLDTPPLIPYSDALLLGPLSDGVIMVLKAGLASGRMVKRARDQAANSGAKLLGAVLNDMHADMMEPQYLNAYRYQAGAAVLPEPAGAVPALRPRILIVEDEAQVRQVMSRFIRAVCPAAEIYEAEDGAEAVNKIAAISPTLIVLDIVLPAVNGLQICSITRRGGGGRTKILAITGLDTEDVRRKAIEVGADDFLPKPFDPEAAQEKLRKLLAIG